MRKGKRTRKKIIVALLGLLCIMTVGYAAFSTVLNISGTANITSNWDVRITNVSTDTIVGEATNAVTPSWTNLTANMEAYLYNKGDYITYLVTIENRGTFNAELDGVIINGNNNSAVKITSSGYTIGEILAPNSSKIITVKIEYDPNKTGVIGESNEISIDFHYVQEGTGPGTGLVKEPGGTLKVMAPWNSQWWDCEILKYENKTLTFKTDMETPDNVTKTCDIGVEPGTVTLWEVGYGNIIIGSDGRIMANPNSSYLFYGFGDGTGNTTINGLENLDTSNVTNMMGMFSSYYGPRSLDLSSFDTSNVTNMSVMFSSSMIDNLNVSGWDTSKVTDMSWMFCDHDGSSTFSFPNLDLSSWDTSNVTNMNAMFRGLYSLSSLNVSGWDTSNVTDMEYMFTFLPNLTMLNGLENFNTSNVTNMYEMFSQNGLTSLNLSNFNTSKVTNMGYMFAGAKETTLNLSSFDTSKAELWGMFEGMTNLTSLDFRNATCSGPWCEEISEGMFWGAKTGATIYTKDNTTKTWLQIGYPSGNYIIP